MFEELKKRLENQYSDKWFVEHGATDDGLSLVDDGTSSMGGLWPFYGEAGDMEFVVAMRNELPAVLERMESLEKENENLKADLKLANDMADSPGHAYSYQELLRGERQCFKRFFDGVEAVRQEIFDEIQRRRQHHNLGKKGCVRRLDELLARFK